MKIRKFQERDAEAVSELLKVTLRTTNSKDYSSEYIEKQVKTHQQKDVLAWASFMHIYVVCDGDIIVGSGAVGPYWGKTDESWFSMIFVHPEYQGKGIGRKIIQTLERDEYFLRAERIEIPASITAVPFYLKMGYDYKNGISAPDSEGLVRMERFR